MPLPTFQHSHRDHSPGVHVTAGASRVDGALVYDNGFCGMAVKQTYPSAAVVAAASPSTAIAIASSEKYYILDSGEVDVDIPNSLTPVKGDHLFIHTSTGVVSINNTTTIAANTVKLGAVRYISPERGLPSGTMTVGFDARKDF